MDGQFRVIALDQPHQFRGFGDHTFRTPLSPLGGLAEDAEEFFFCNVGVDGYPHLATMVGSNINCLFDLAVFQFPGAFPSAESLCSDIDRISATGKNLCHHFKAATWSQQLIHGKKSSSL